MEDRDIEWMAQLDWSEHKQLATKSVSENMPLATAASILAEHAAGPSWPYEINDFLSLAGNRPRGAWVLAEEAFTSDGRPTSLYHDRLDLALENAKHWDVPLAAVDAVTMEEWREIETTADGDWAEGEGARRMIWRLAPLIAELAHRNNGVRTWARPRNGSEDEGQEIHRAKWRLDPEAAIRRLAACALDPANPFADDAPRTHRIFVEKIGLEAVLKEAARDAYIPHAFVDEVFPRPIDEVAPSRQAQKSFLANLMRQHPRWTKDVLHAAVEERYGIEFPERTHRNFRKEILEADRQLAEQMTKTGPKRD